MRAGRLCSSPLLALILVGFGYLPASSTTPTISLTSCAVVAGNGNAGNADGQLSGPHGIHVDTASGALYVADTTNGRIMMWSDGASTGQRVAGGSTPGSSSATTQLWDPMRLAIRPSDSKLVIAESGSNRVSLWTAGASSGSELATGLSDPHGLALTASEELLVAMGPNHNEGYVQKFPAAGGTGVNWAGHFQTRMIDVDVGGDGRIYTLNKVGNVARFSSSGGINTDFDWIATSGGVGELLNQMQEPRGLKVDSTGQPWIADTGNNRVLKCDNGPQGVCELMLDGLSEPWDIAFDATEDNFYVVEKALHRVIKCPARPPTTTTTLTTTTSTTLTTTTSFTSTSTETTSVTGTTSSSTSSSTGSTSTSSSTSSFTGTSSTSSTSRTLSSTSSTSRTLSSTSSTSSTSRSSTTSHSTTTTSSSSSTTSSSSSVSSTATWTSSTTSSSSTSTSSSGTSSTSTSTTTTTTSTATTSSSTSTTTRTRTSTTSSTTTTSISTTTTSTGTTTTSTSTATTSTSTSTTTRTSTSTTTSTTTRSSTTTTTVTATSTTSSTTTSTLSRTSTTASSTVTTSSSTTTTSSSVTMTPTSTTNTSSTTTSFTTTRSTLSKTTTTSSTTSSRSTSITATTTVSTVTSTTITTSRTDTSSASSTSSTSTASSTTTSNTTTTTTTSTSTSTRVTSSSSLATTSSSSSSSSSSSTPLSSTEQTSPAEVAAELLESVANVSAGLLARLQGSGSEEQATVSIPGGTLTALRLSAPESLANSSSDTVKVSVAAAEGAMEVTIPRTVFEDLPASSVPGDSLVLVVSAFSAESSASLGGQQGDSGDSENQEGSGTKVKLQVLSAVSIDLSYLLSGETPEVKRLEKPIAFQLPGANYSAGLRCAYWNEEDRLWSFEGVEAPGESNEAGKPLVCHTYHLSFFAAILQSFIATLECAQFGLMSAEAIENLFSDSAWLNSPSAWVCWAIFAGIAVAFGIATVLDVKRERSLRWRDEFFLVAMGTVDIEAPAEREIEMETPAESESELEPGEAATRVSSPVARALTGGLLVASACMQCICASSAFREALDEILSNWFEHWGQLRGACESLCEVLAEGSSATAAALTHKATATLLMASSRRLVAASLGMSNEAVAFVLEDEDLQDYIMETPSDAAVGTRADDWRTLEDQRQAWTSLHDTVVQHVLEHTHRHTACGLPRIVMEFFLFHNPLGALFVHDIFHSCKKRVLLLAVDLMGALAMSCVFFDAAGMVRGKPTSLVQECEGDGSVAWRIGRFLAIATGALLVSGLPLAFIDSLHTKGFRKLDHPGSEAWKKQLRIWAAQDIIVWVVSLLYIAFCVFFVLVFLASIGPSDHQDWSFAGLLALIEDFVLMPAFLAFCVPTTTAACLHLHGRFHKTGRAAVLRRTHETLLQQTNMMMPIMRV